MSRESELELFAISAPGLEPVVAAELEGIGARGEVEVGGVRWTGTATDVFEANLRLRTASRVLVRVASFGARTFHELERHGRRIPWDRFVQPGGAVRLRVTSRKSRLYHEKAIAERILDSIGRAVSGVETSADGDVGQLFVVRVFRDRCTVSADTSGELLHRRGYRQAVAKAPIRETLAAAMLLAAHWRPGAPLLDPFCGSGTIPIEAALLARSIPPGMADPDLQPRHFAFQDWPDHDVDRWRAVVDRARAQVRPTAGAPILGSDRDAGAIAAALANATRAGVANDIAFEHRALSAVTPPRGAGWLVTNPPHGVRVGDRARLRDLYAALGNFARERLVGWTVAVLSADRRLDGYTGIALDDVVTTVNGGIPVRIAVGRVRGRADPATG